MPVSSISNGLIMANSPEPACRLLLDDVAVTLKGEVRGIALVGVGALAATSIALVVTLGPDGAIGWLLIALACWGFVLWQCYRRLHLNRSVDTGTYYPRLGHANRVTLFRGWLIAATAGFLIAAYRGVGFGDMPPGLFYVPAAFYTLAAAGDWLDGYMARRQQQITQLGMELDTVLDAFGLLIAPLLAVLAGKLHISYLLVSVAYYLFQWGISWRQRHGRHVFPLSPSRLRRYLAGIQMALVSIALWPFVPAGLSTGFGIALMIPLLVGFCRDWLHVSGRLSVSRQHSA
jgi:CDP-diacylglycerol--glycerol-3-phosphate 3-phosphatidyltransferase